MSAIDASGAELPPHDADAERAVLGAVRLAPKAWPEVSATLHADDFFVPAHREIFEAMGALASRAAPVDDAVLLGDELRSRGEIKRLPGGEQYIGDLLNATHSAANVTHYVDVVARKAALRKLRLVSAEIVSRSENDPDEAQRLVLESQRLLQEVSRGRRRQGVDIADLVDPLLAEFDARSQARAAGPGRVTGISVGLTDLDYLTGGLQPGWLTVIGARTSLGKTAFACQIALLGAVHAGVPALIFSLEMTPRELMERFFSRLSGVESQRLRGGEITVEDSRRLQGAGEQMSARGMVTISKSRSLGAIISESRAFRVLNPDRRALVVVDYVQMVRTGERGRTREQEVADITNGLKGIATDLELPVVAPAQLNRGPEAEDREPEISDLRESGAIENDSDVIILIARKRGDKSGACSLHVKKNRHGALGEVAAHWHGATYQLRDADHHLPPYQDRDN